MITAMEASTVDMTTPNDGTPVRDMRLNRSGNSPSFAAASGISAQIMVQPLSAPNPEMITAMAMMLPAQLPPNIALTVSENGAVDSPSCAVGTTPNTTMSESMYTTAQAIVPRMVARGTLRS